ncbi:hypothetical protein DM02DRAFT_436048 [Periconia macrospinosa]|uniref:Uncharacterized protein n=1 Tax=Periconia macrospinosa TaxID=97972 RepID=A0A2V1DML5_9PLEO|nr:hypothetical protein DM02DRAFT_436048 [Periconia macrospinosa]
MTPPQNSSQPFKSYKEYTKFVHENLPRKIEAPFSKDMWLGQISDNIPCLQWYRYTGADYYPDPDSNDFASHGSGVSAYKSTAKASVFQSQLLIETNSISQQILIIMRKEVSSNNWDKAEKHRWRNFYDWASDICGLGLDIPLEIWDYLGGRIELGARDVENNPIPWIGNCPIVDVGDHSLLLMPKVSVTRPNTGRFPYTH